MKMNSLLIQPAQLAQSVDVSTQTDDLICADELLDEVQPEQTDRICEGNNDIKFHPLVIQHSGIFRNSQGACCLYSCVQSVFS